MVIIYTPLYSERLLLQNIKKLAWIQKAVYVEKLKTKKDITILNLAFLKHILTHIVSLLNKMINEIKKCLPSKVKSITAEV